MDMTAPAFLDMLLEVENGMGRRRESAVQDPAVRFGPRVIDLDLLLFDKERHENAHLTLPHPRMLERAFVLVPLRDIDPYLTLPGGLTPGGGSAFPRPCRGREPHSPVTATGAINHVEVVDPCPCGLCLVPLFMMEPDKEEQG